MCEASTAAARALAPDGPVNDEGPATHLVSHAGLERTLTAADSNLPRAIPATELAAPASLDLVVNAPAADEVSFLSMPSECRVSRLMLLRLWPACLRQS